MPAISALGRLRQEDHEFEVTVGYSLPIADKYTLFLCSLRAEGRMGMEEELGPGI